MTAPHPSKTHIGNHALHPETQMLNYGYHPELSEGAVKPPVFLTSTFVFKSAEDGRDFFDYVSGRKEPPEGRGMDDPVAAALEDVARTARPVIRFPVGPAARLGRLRGKWGHHSEGNFLTVWPGWLVHVKASMRTDARSSMKMPASRVLRNGPISNRARGPSWTT